MNVTNFHKISGSLGKRESMDKAVGRGIWKRFEPVASRRLRLLFAKGLGTLPDVGSKVSLVKCTALNSICSKYSLPHY
jgi:hypothetical protein